MDSLLPLARVSREVYLTKVLLTSSVQHRNDELKVEVALRKVECGYCLGLLDEGKSALWVGTNGITRKVKVHQSELHVLVLFHAVCQ